ncbi:MAG: LysM peptidoglycan-binding domain-containing protein [Acidimicrobiales bacterium]
MRAKVPSTHRHRRNHRRRRPRKLVALAAVAGLAVVGPAATGTHTVRLGETLSEIAADHNATVAAIAQANGIGDIHRVLAGRALQIPDGGGGAGSPSAHRIARGETLSGLAARYRVTVRALAEANGIGDVHRIRAGERLAIPAGNGVVAVAGGAADVSRFPARLQASPSRLALVPRFEHYASTYGVPADLLMAMTWLESGWQNDVVSSAGAVGIGQLMPDTVTWMRDIIIGEPLDPNDPDDNIRMSARYLRWLLDRTGGDPATALAGYYQGLGAVRASGVFPSTRVYVADVLAFRDQRF